jgi:hypothetical protein
MQEQSPKWSLAIHGGAGSMRPETMPVADRAPYLAGLEAALAAGCAVLAAGGSALDAVSAAVMVLEDDPHFNAGRVEFVGAVIGEHRAAPGVEQRIVLQRHHCRTHRIHRAAARAQHRASRVERHSQRRLVDGGGGRVHR